MRNLFVSSTGLRTLNIPIEDDVIHILVQDIFTELSKACPSVLEVNDAVDYVAYLSLTIPAFFRTNIPTCSKWNLRY